MMTSRFLLSASMLLSGLAAATSANADPCASGGSLTITASADSLTLSPVAATTFHFGEHVILTASASGFTIATYAWTVQRGTITSGAGTNAITFSTGNRDVTIQVTVTGAGGCSSSSSKVVPLNPGC